MRLETFRDLPPDGQHGVEGRHRLLEDHRDLAPAHTAHGFFVEREQVTALEEDAAADDAAGRRGDEPHDRQRADGFAAAGLAHERDGLAFGDVPRHAVDGADDAAARQKMRLEVDDLEEGTHSARECSMCRGALRLCRGAAERGGVWGAISGPLSYIVPSRAPPRRRRGPRTRGRRPPPHRASDAAWPSAAPRGRAASAARRRPARA